MFTFLWIHQWINQFIIVALLNRLRPLFMEVSDPLTLKCQIDSFLKYCANLNMFYVLIHQCWHLGPCHTVIAFYNVVILGVYKNIYYVCCVYDSFCLPLDKRLSTVEPSETRMVTGAGLSSVPVKVSYVMIFNS